MSDNLQNTCFVTSCKKLCVSNEVLLKHITLKHPYQKSFSCVEKTCLRSFNLFNSYKKHRRNFHKDSFVDVSILTNQNFVNIPNPDCSDVLNNSAQENEDIDLLLQNKNCVNGTQNVNIAGSDETTGIDARVLLLAKLHHYSDITRSRVMSIIGDISQFVNREMDFIISNLEKNMHLSDECKKIIENRKDPFKNLDSEYLQLKLFKELGTYVPPQQIILGEREDFRKKENKMTLVKVKTCAEFIPLGSVLKLFFELPSVYDQTIEYMKMLNALPDKTIINFLQSKFWRERANSFNNCGKLVMPIFLYFDDFENNNVLGSHAGLAKCGAVYISIPCLPDELRSKLENIFPFCLFNTLDRKVFKNEKVFQQVMIELELLEKNGININVNNKSIKIYFALALLLGDNLGLHAIFGLSESFRGHYPCRFCYIHFDDLSKYFSETELLALGLLRNEDNYATDVNNISSTNNSHGIVEECILHKFPNFHIVKNICVDIPHDLFEGVVHYDLAKLLKVFISKKQYFSLKQLNARINSFDYQEWENKPTEISEIHIKRCKLKMSASETMSFVRNFTFLIGDLIIDTTDPYWQLFLKLKKMIDAIMEPICYPNSDKYLAVLISEYLIELVSLFPNSMKPKHHFLLHYPRVQAQMGPLWLLSSMRFESKHKEGKTVSKNAICRINVCHTIMIKHQLKLNYRFLSQEKSVPPIWSFGPSKRVTLINIPHFKNFKYLLPDDRDSHVHQLKWVMMFSKKIKPGSFFAEYNEQNDVSFLKIKQLLLLKNGFLILAQKFNKSMFNTHFNCYELNLSDNYEFSWVSLSTYDIEGLRICSVYQNFININTF